MPRGFLNRRSFVAAAVLGVVAAVLVGVGAAATSINPSNAPNGTHYKSGTASCSVSGTTVVKTSSGTWSGRAHQIRHSLSSN